jgi:hypothetical protein
MGTELKATKVKMGAKYTNEENGDVFVPEHAGRNHDGTGTEKLDVPAQDGVFVGTLTRSDGQVLKGHEVAAMSFLRGVWRAP